MHEEREEGRAGKEGSEERSVQKHLEVRSKDFAKSIDEYVLVLHLPDALAAISAA